MNLHKSFQPKFAHRTSMLVPEGAYAVLSAASELEKKGEKIIHFEIGQPDFPTPKNIVHAGIKAIQSGFTKYSPPLGILPLRKKIAEEINISRNIDISEKQIAITPSGKNAIFTAMAAILERGDEVIYPDPGFPTYRTLIDFFGAIPKPVQLIEANGFGFNIKAFKRKFSLKTKLIILNSPSNPTGGILSVDDLREIADYIQHSNCWVITDEIYSKIIYGINPYPSFYGLKNIQNRTILVDGFSKSFSMTGWRIGYMSLPEEMISKIDCLLTHSIGCTATFTQYAALQGLSGSQKHVSIMRQELKKRRDYVVTELNNMKGIQCQYPMGAFYVFPNIKSYKRSSKWLAHYILNKAGVALLDGTSFGHFGEGYLRISYATSMENLTEGLKKIHSALSKL